MSTSPAPVSLVHAAREAAQRQKLPPVPVDNPNTPSPGIFTEKRRPILASWLTTRRDFLAMAVHTSANVGYAALYHGLRVGCGVYACRLAARAPLGFGRTVTGLWRWIWDQEAAPLRGFAVDRDQIPEYLALTRKRDQRVRLRGLVAIVAGTVGLALAMTLYVLAPWWLAVFGAAAVLGLGYVGQQPDAPVIGPAVVKTEVQRLTGPIVLRALGAIGIAQISAALKKGGDMDGMHFTSEICRDGPGYRADLDLPLGVTPAEIMEKREALASGLRRKLGCVWPSGDPDEHEGRLVLYVGDKPMNETTKPAWPLLKSGMVDVFRPVVFGNDQRMRDVAVTLMFASIVIGSIPRMGKTFLLRLLLLIFALDPRSQLYAFDLKGTGDLGALEPVCHRYRAGEEYEDIEYVLLALREIKAELRRRAKVIKSLPRSRCPESKVTPELADDKTLGLHPMVVALDECQKAFEHPKFGEEIEEIATDLTKRGPALGIVGIFATQRPDAKSLPSGVRDNAVLRFCLKVMGHTANDMVLTTGAHKAGIKATMFSRRDLGICWMSGEEDDPRIVCSSYVDATGAEAVVERARKVRERYGNITGHAVGQQPEASEPEFDILADVLKIMAPDEKQLWAERAVARLAHMRPQVYGPWMQLDHKARVMQLTNALKAHGVPIKDVWGQADDGKDTTRRGFERDTITAAITRRNGNRVAA